MLIRVHIHKKPSRIPDIITPYINYDVLIPSKVLQPGLFKFYFHLLHLKRFFSVAIANNAFLVNHALV